MKSIVVDSPGWSETSLDLPNSWSELLSAFTLAIVNLSLNAAVPLFVILTLPASLLSYIVEPVAPFKE